jgi:hypothetical protein
MAGEFEVILELLDAYKANDQGKIGKAQVRHKSGNTHPRNKLDRYKQTSLF